MNNAKRKIRAAKLSIITAVTLSVMKFTVGFMTGSMAVLSSAIDSMLDILMSGVNFLAIRHAEQPADENHAYGHGKFETMATLIQSLVIGGSGVWIAIESINRLVSGDAPARLGGGIIALCISVAVSLWISRHLRRVGKETDSSALIADSLHFSMDVYTNLALLVGMGIMMFFGLYWIDSVLSFFVACYILFEAFKLIRLSLRDVLDEQLPWPLRQRIEEIIKRHGGDESFGYHNLRTRKAGSHKLIDFHMTVCKNLSVADAHQLTEELEQEIQRVVTGTDITIHVEPCCHEDCRQEKGCTQYTECRQDTFR